MYVPTLKGFEDKNFLRFFNLISSSRFLSFSLIARSFSCWILSFSASFSLFFSSLSSDLDILQATNKPACDLYTDKEITESYTNRTSVQNYNNSNNKKSPAGHTYLTTLSIQY